MKVFLLLNGPEGWQTGIEDGFLHLLATRQISDLKFFYFEAYSNNYGARQTLEKSLEISQDFQPDIIVIFHIGALPLTDEFPKKLKNIASKPILVYDEGDMYGSWAKPITRSMAIMFRHAGIISVRGLGEFSEKIVKINSNIIYTPHHADIARFDTEPFILEKRKSKIVFIGNNLKPKILGSLRRIPGSLNRQKFVEEMSTAFPKDFQVYGNGWDKILNNQGPVEFQKQLDVYRESWITVAYEHYPNIPYYFSNRLPLALLAGSLYICHYHKGYEQIFKNCDFMFFFESTSEAIDLVRFVLSLENEDLIARSKKAREFALKHYHPHATWTNFFNNILAHQRS